MSKTTSIMIVGVGGQGTLLASRILGTAIIKSGFDVKVSEVHGMSQRGGSVETYVKFGEKVWSPIVNKGDADIILAFEQLEAYRALPYLKKDGKIIINDQQINPIPVIAGQAKYPQNLMEDMKSRADVTAVDALSLAIEAGNKKAVNVVLLGVMAKKTDIPYEYWKHSLKETVPEKFLKLNLEAFDLGYNI